MPSLSAGWLRLTALVVAAAASIGGATVSAQTPIAVPNFSFESPTTSFVNTNITSWQKLPQPANFNGQGYTWDEIAGIFANDSPGASDYIANMNGNQAAYIFNDQGMGITQTLTNTYQVGASYRLTVGVVGQGGGMPDGSVLNIQLYYLDANSNMVVIASTTAVENSTNFPNHTTEYDYTASLPAVKSTDAWAGKHVGIEIVSPAGAPSLLGGYWDVDNVRLNVPTPGGPGLIGCLGALLSLRGWARNLARRDS